MNFSPINFNQINQLSFNHMNPIYRINQMNQMNKMNQKTVLRSMNNVPKIYLSDAIYAQNPNNLVNSGIKLIINASSDSPASQQVQQIYKTMGIDYLWVPINDNNENLPVGYLSKILEYVNNRGNNGDILIHCTAGINRSALVAAAILWYTTPNRALYWDTPKKMIDYMRIKQMVDRKTYLLINNTFYIHLIQNLK